MTQIKKWAALASGAGNTLNHIYEAGLRPELVVVSKECPAAEKARARGIEVVVMPGEGTYTPENGCNEARRKYTIKVAALLKERGIELVFMAGWMIVFSTEMFTNKYFGHRVLNTHPSLLPNFKGDRAIADALKAKVKETGCTVHIATLEVDTGPILGQERVEVLEDDDLNSLKERIQQKERPLCAKIVAQVLTGGIDLDAVWAEWQLESSSTSQN